MVRKPIPPSLLLAVLKAPATDELDLHPVQGPLMRSMQLLRTIEEDQLQHRACASMCVRVSMYVCIDVH